MGRKKGSTLANSRQKIIFAAIDATGSEDVVELRKWIQETHGIEMKEGTIATAKRVKKLRQKELVRTCLDLLERHSIFDIQVALREASDSFKKKTEPEEPDDEDE